MKTVCIYHSIDLDGWMSAAIVKHWFVNNQSSDYYIYDFHDYEKPSGEVSELCFLGWNYGDPVPDLSEYDKVIMCDISFPKEEMRKLLDSVELVWIDHHISAIKENWAISEETDGLRDAKFAACELTWMYFFPSLSSESPWDGMPEIVRLLGRYDCFGHKGTDEEQKVLEFQYGARQCISNYEDAYVYLNAKDFGAYSVDTILTKGKSIYQYLCTEAKQVYKNGFEIIFTEIVTPGNAAYKVTYKFICFNRERFNPVNFGIDYHKDGYDGAACFHYANGMWNFSLYNDNGKVDCSVIAKQFGGGGHKGAAGFRLENIEGFFKRHKV